MKRVNSKQPKQKWHTIWHMVYLTINYPSCGLLNLISPSTVHIKANRLRLDIRLDLLFQSPDLVSSESIYFRRHLQNTELHPKVFSDELRFHPTSSGRTVCGVGFTSSCSTSWFLPLRLNIARVPSAIKAKPCSSRCSLTR